MADERRDVFRIPGFLAYWSSYTVSGFGTYVTTLALQVLVVHSLHGSAADVGLLNGARWLAYLALGLVVGALVDRRRRRPLMTVGWIVIAHAPTRPHVLCIVILAAGQAFYGLGNANEMGFRQAITPDRLQGRTNTTIRSLNRAMIVIGAPAGGLLAVSLGYRPTLWIAIVGFLAVAAFLAASPFRLARHPEESQ